MKPQPATTRMLAYLIFWHSLLFTFMAAVTTMTISLIFMIKTGIFNINKEDTIFIFKAGFSCGIPTGFGIWLFSKINEIIKNRRTDQ